MKLNRLSKVAIGVAAACGVCSRGTQMGGF